MSKALKSSVTRKFTFEACHHLENYDGDCAKLHGHSYKLFVTVSGDFEIDSKVAKDGMVIDFKELDSIVKEHIINEYDHANINDILPQPTAENMALDIFCTLMDYMPEDVQIEKVKLYETEDSYAEISRN